MELGTPIIFLNHFVLKKLIIILVKKFFPFHFLIKWDLQVKMFFLLERFTYIFYKALHLLQLLQLSFLEPCSHLFFLELIHRNYSDNQAFIQQFFFSENPCLSIKFSNALLNPKEFPSIKNILLSMDSPLNYKKPKVHW